MTNTNIIIKNSDTTTNDNMMTPDQWQICQWMNFRPSKADLLSDYICPAEEQHMRLEPDDDISISLKDQKRQQKLSPGSCRERSESDSDVTIATEPTSMDEDDLSFLDECMIAHQEEEEEAQDHLHQPLFRLEDEDDTSCVDDAVRLALEYPLSDDEDYENIIDDIVEMAPWRMPPLVLGY